ncbi:cupin domain-containing protein [Dokdonia sinensis]|uniref:Cupin domain-containing protein n=1 Tax=Dokdonia sinensis TaxID=2479847 RepID=A0A3M0G4F9_9FLAO|nr:cupin domain-containing protein [Dokdonia sinensis]RMB59458.1 cupin domain-containing protein [Dokdonia sinensis]
MKKIILILVLVVSMGAVAQETDYSVSSYIDEGFKAPNTHYIGEAWLNRILQEGDDLPYNLVKATFKANSTLDWHKHGTAQVLIIVEGIGYYQEKGKEPYLMKTGDIIKCPKNTEHWHSSSTDNDVTYLALYSGEIPTEWTQVVTQEYYDGVAEKLKNE